MSHSRKILSQAGTSLADVYDIEGSVVGLEALDVEEVKAVHDLGPQIHSERLRSVVVLMSSTAVGQNTGWDIGTGQLPDSVNRIIGTTVIPLTAARVANAQLSIRNFDTGRETPIWNWDTGNDIESPIRWSNEGAGAIAVNVLRTVGAYWQLPTLCTRMEDQSSMPNLIFRGLTSGFGAGTVEVLALITLCRPDRATPMPGDPRSHGLPIPSW